MIRIIQFILRVAIFVGGFVVIKKFRRKARPGSLILSVGILILLTVCAFLPVENLFLTFSSPEAVLEYMGVDEVKLVVNGETTAFVIASDRKNDLHTIVPRTDDGWQLGTGIHTRKAVHEIFDGISVYIFQYRDSEEYYIKVSDLSDGSPLTLSDNRESRFYDLIGDLSPDRTSHIYYAYVRGFDEDYELTVNGNTYSVAVD